MTPILIKLKLRLKPRHNADLPFKSHDLNQPHAQSRDANGTCGHVASLAFSQH